MQQQIAVLEPITVPVCVSLAHAEIEQALAYAEMEKKEGTRRRIGTPSRTRRRPTAWWSASMAASAARC